MFNLSIERPCPRQIHFALGTIVYLFNVYVLLMMFSALVCFCSSAICPKILSLLLLLLLIINIPKSFNGIHSCCEIPAVQRNVCVFCHVETQTL